MKFLVLKVYSIQKIFYLFLTTLIYHNNKNLLLIFFKNFDKLINILD